MARMPGALWRPLPRRLVPMRAYEILCEHTMVGSLWGTDGYFRSPGVGTSSHFGTGGDGTIIQWIDTAYRAGANLDGNDEVIAVENADMGPEFAPWNTRDGNAVPAFTEAQIEANAKIAAWVHEVHGIRLDLTPDSLPSRRGCGYHRLGVDPYRVPGGVKWSNAYGKACPGPRRIAQIPQIITRARQLISGGNPEELDMDEATVRKIIASELDKFAKDLVRADVLHNRAAAVLENSKKADQPGTLAYISAKVDELAADDAPPPAA